MFTHKTTTITEKSRTRSRGLQGRQNGREKYKCKSLGSSCHHHWQQYQQRPKHFG